MVNNSHNNFSKQAVLEAVFLKFQMILSLNWLQHQLRCLDLCQCPLILSPLYLHILSLQC
ncbi:unnamed protein product [Meloidogyne enterolobii]|uniref:Uncharacterized protein n=1 Tax=Meloidogyne enterolobii TaxID=390850 RepID=A0ACB0YF05_MELEN